MENHRYFSGRHFEDSLENLKLEFLKKKPPLLYCGLLKSLKQSTRDSPEPENFKFPETQRWLDVDKSKSSKQYSIRCFPQIHMFYDYLVFISLFYVQIQLC